MRHGQATLPHLPSPYKGEEKNTAIHAQADHPVNKYVNIYNPTYPSSACFSVAWNVRYPNGVSKK